MKSAWEEAQQFLLPCLWLKMHNGEGESIDQSLDHMKWSKIILEMENETEGPLIIIFWQNSP